MYACVVVKGVRCRRPVPDGDNIACVKASIIRITVQLQVVIQ